MSLNDKTTVLVTGVSQNSVGHQIVKSLLLYKDLYRIIGSNINAARKSDYELELFETLPHSSSPDYIYKLIELCKKNNVSAILPGSEDELILISREANLIEQNGIKPITLNYETVNLCLNKNSLNKAMEALHIPHPSSVRIDSKTDLNSIELYPLVLKPERGSGSKGVIIVQTVNELKSLVPIWLENYGELVGQEYIESTSGEYTVGVITDPFDGLVRNSIIMKRSILDGIGHGSKVVNNLEVELKSLF